MSSAASPEVVELLPGERLELLFAELAELTGQRNAIDGRIVEIVAEVDRDELWGNTGARSVAALVAWKTGCSAPNATSIATVAHRLAEFPHCAQGMREGRLSLDQVGVIAKSAGEGSDEHYAALASASHRDALIAQWKHDHGDRDDAADHMPPLPDTVDAFLRLVEMGWDADATRRPHGHHTTVVVHVDVDKRAASYHLGPLLTDADRQYLTCDATCEVWFERDGQVIGAGRATRVINRRLRRALEHRDHTCVVPGCGATRGLHAHHITHWEDGGLTELANLCLLCPYHHRLHHRGGITVAGRADDLQITDSDGRALTAAALAHPPTTSPPAVGPCPGPTGERADWWWYEPFRPQPPPTNN